MNFMPPHLRILRELDESIAIYPDEPINYVLRGEFWIKYFQAEKALPDFEKAIHLAQIELERSDWEYREQAIIDRAQQGIRVAKQFL